MAPVLIKPIPDQIINEGAAFGPVDLKPFFQKEEDEVLTFQAELEGGLMLPKGMILTSDGLLTGIPAKGTEGISAVILQVATASGAIETTFQLIIKASLLQSRSNEEFDKMKSKVWEALQEHLPIPEIENLFSGPITLEEVAYLMERWGIIKIWDAFNLDPPADKQLLQLEGVSEHYNVYDRGCYIIACPKELFSQERTVGDGLVTAKALAREAYQRGWTVELTGYYKFTRAAWVEIQHLGDKYGKRMDVINFEPTHEELVLYHKEASLNEPKFG